MNPSSMAVVANAIVFEDRAAMQDLLAHWAARGWLRLLDTAFAEFLAQEVDDVRPSLLLAAALVSHQLGRGHACLDLAQTLEAPALVLSLPPEGDETADADDCPPLPASVLAGITLERWLNEVSHPQLVTDGPGKTPLVRIGTRLYVRRYWQYEQHVRAGLRQRLESVQPNALPETLLRETLDALFPVKAAEVDVDWQKVACALAARSPFSIITGGPGTGKTTTVVKLLALLQAVALGAEHDDAPGRCLRIRLAAPTGKAAARLNESIAGAVAKLPLGALARGEEIRRAIPVQVTTLHRLLGTTPDSRHFRHDARNPLALDVLVIDEASMVDLEMTAAVLAALPPSARLILLGDKDQLASVEAGAVLGELCARAHDGHYTPDTCAWIEAVTGEKIDGKLVDAGGTPLDQGIAMLRHSYRFTKESGIGQLATAVNTGSPSLVSDALGFGYEDLAVIAPADEGDAVFRDLVIEGAKPGPEGATGAPRENVEAARRGYRHFLETLREVRPTVDAGEEAFDGWANRVLKAHGRFQLLCAVRRGPWGVDGLNQRIARLLHEAGLIPASEGWYCGRPVLVTKNDYGLGLMNGDIGITLERPGPDGKPTLRVAFPSGDGKNGIRWILPSRLQAVETVFALTVHKSQGSEFDHAALIIPETLSPVLTRELIYTGITRARHWFTLAHAGSTQTVRQAVERRVSRVCGLMVDGNT